MARVRRRADLGLAHPVSGCEWTIRPPLLYVRRPSQPSSGCSQRPEVQPSRISLAAAVFLSVLVFVGSSIPQDAEHLTAMVGDSIVFNCHVEFPESHPVPYVIQWKKKGLDIPIYIWYDNYLHVGEGYEGRISRVAPGSAYGLASLNLTKIRETDQGWYLCVVEFLNRQPRQDKNGTWFHLNVHAPPRFTMTPGDVVYVSLGDPIILHCQAEGTPEPEILWYRDGDLVHPSATLGVFNDGTELRVSTIRQEDIGDYTCVARNGEGTVRHTTKIVVAGAAVIIVPPHNVTRLEGDKVEMPCEARGLPGNFTVTWYRENQPVRSLAWLESRTSIKRDGSFVISPVHSDDRGYYTCEVSNGIGEPQRASAFLEVEYAARASFTPTVQYLPLKMSGIIQCHVEANPPFQFITWTKDKRIFDPFEIPNVVVLNNGSLLFQKVTHDNQGRYTCTPYNVHGTAGSSGSMEVLVREPPVFTVKPPPTFQRRIDDEVQMNCEAQGTPKPSVTWRRVDGKPLPRDRSKIEQGNIAISSLKRSDFGFYECVVSNEVATLVATTHLVIEGTTPHAPYNITCEASEFSVTLEWLPGYNGGAEIQKYIVWYRQDGAPKWIPMEVDPPGSTKATIHNLEPGTTYEFQVIGKNVLGDGMFSNIVKETTKEIRDYSVVVYPTYTNGSTYIPTVFRPKGPSPLAPRNLNITDSGDGYLLTWTQPKDESIAVAYYTIDYCTDEQWKRLSKTHIKPHENTFLIKNLNQGRTYFFRVNAHTLTNQASSEKFKFAVPQRVKDKAITAGIVGGILFFIVAIILAVCTVKCVNKRNKRRRREQEKAYSMVACRVTDTRNGSQTGPKSVPLKKGRPSGLPTLRSRGSLKRGVASLNHALRHRLRPKTRPADKTDGTATDAADWQEYGGGEVQTRRRNHRRARYSVEAEFLEPPGWISRTAEGKFVLDEQHVMQQQPTSPLSAYFNPYFGPIVESGVYRVAGDSDRPRQQPIVRREFSPVATETAYYSPQFGQHRVPSHPPLSSQRKTLRSSSPGPGLLSPSFTNFSDLSSVRQPSSAERSFPTTLISSQTDTPQESAFNRAFPHALPLSPSVAHSRYVRELPSLLPLHEQLSKPQRYRAEVEVHAETPRSGFSARGLLLNSGRHVHAPLRPPPFRPPPEYHLPYTISYPSQRPLATSSPPRSRVAVTVRKRQSPLTIAVPGGSRSGRRGAFTEYSPQSQSSSSGIDSKNTSQQNQSSQSGSGSGQSQLMPDSSSSLLTPPQRRPKAESHYVNWPMDVLTPPTVSVLDASVDNHYEFDTTQSPSDPDVSTAPLISSTGPSGPGPPRRKPPARYENIEARVQAMKQEFQEYRRRRARGLLESAC